MRLPRHTRERLAFWALVLGLASLPAALLVGWIALGAALVGLGGFAAAGALALREPARSAWEGAMRSEGREPHAPHSPGIASPSTARPSLAAVRLSACVACDEAMLGWMQVRARVPTEDAIASLARELERGLALDEAGVDPLERRPPPLAGAELHSFRFRGERFAELRAQSGWTPAPGAPGWERWAACDEHRTLCAAVLRHPGAPRPWLICLHGYRMGEADLNLRLFDPLRLYRALGLNLLVPVLPLHGVRRIGRRSGDYFLDGRLVETRHALCQSVWELRSLIGWARAEGAPAVGLYGVSLGAMPAALAAALEPDLDLVLLGVPLADVSDALWRHAPAKSLRAHESAGVTRALVQKWLEPVDPLARPPKLAPERLALYAARGDRIAPPHHATRLWQHWGRPSLEWLDAGHLTFFSDPRFKHFEAAVLSRLWH
jgi:hypothetical protein